MKNREIKFRSFIEGEMLGADVLAFEEYGLLQDQLGSCPTLMQFTGLKDKNGVEIYEGDIVVRTGYYYGTNSKPKPIVKTGAVKWNEETASFLFYVGHYLGLFADNLEIEVLGNLYEHPHLLTPQS